MQPKFPLVELSVSVYLHTWRKGCCLLSGLGAPIPAGFQPFLWSSLNGERANYCPKPPEFPAPPF